MMLRFVPFLRTKSLSAGRGKSVEDDVLWILFSAQRRSEGVAPTVMRDVASGEILCAGEMAVNPRQTNTGSSPQSLVDDGVDSPTPSF